jgi:hypothetical protein
MKRWKARRNDKRNDSDEAIACSNKVSAHCRVKEGEVESKRSARIFQGSRLSDKYSIDEAEEVTSRMSDLVVNLESF